MHRYAQPFALLIVLAVSEMCAMPYHAISIPLRDGKNLAADMYAIDTTAAKPVILIQTPYNRIPYRVRVAIPQAGGNIFPLDSVAYNYVVADWRGFYGSLAAAVPGYDRGLDGYDAVEWIAARPWCNGRIGTFGGSALGMIQFQTAKHRPPHLVCCVPMVKDYKTKYEDFFCGGVLRREHVESLDSLGFIPIETIIAHPAKDVYWQVAEQAADYPDSFAVPMFLISGWFDHFPEGVLRAFRDMGQRSDPQVRDLHRLLMGPWTHGAIGARAQGSLEYPAATRVPDSLIMEFFARYLRDVNNSWEQRPYIEYFQMGTDEWRTGSDWYDVAQAIDTLYLSKDNGLQAAPSAAGEAPDSFTFDPRDPTPALGGSRFDPFDASVLIGPQDLSVAVETRSDVIVFSTAPLDAPVELDGQAIVDLYVSIDRSDADVAVRLCDVYPDGRSMIMQQGIRRVRFRDSYATEALAVPGTVYKVSVVLPDLALTFLPGHSIRLIVSGADYPHFDMNLNNGGAMYAAGDTLAAIIAIHHDAQNQSRIVLPLAAGTIHAQYNAAARTYAAHENSMRPAAVLRAGMMPKGKFGRIYDIRGRRIESAGFGKRASARPAGIIIAGR